MMVKINGTDMKKLAATLILVASSFGAMSQTLDVSKLTEAQRAELSTQVSKLSSSPVNVSATVREEAEAWGALGANMGKALVGAAREVGVASNEFASTPLGMITVAIVAYKLIGRDILGVLVGLLLMAVAWLVALYVWFSRRWNDNVKYEYTTFLGGLIRRTRVIDSGEITEGVYAFKLMIGTILIVAGTGVSLSLIF
jgi:hypothetical protein